MHGTATLASGLFPLSEGLPGGVSGYWNSWFNIMLFMPSDSSKWPLQMVLYDYLTQNSQMVSAAAGFQGATPTLALQMAVVTITIVPVVIVYPFVQKHFTKGVLLGAVKG